MSSIDHVLDNDSADISAEQIAGDSGGSDTDTGAPSKDTSKDVHHTRSNSVKKPTTFKAVSVTKNFLAKAGAPPTPVKNEVPPPTTMPPAPRPRLVAKSASASKGAPTASNVGAKNGISGPDPMQVWNRNRVTPQPTQKHFTDEELKQQYGIHLATRLQADSDGKEAKWADIDDDEDDWAPEAIEWNDGTKITISQNDPVIDDTPVVEEKKEEPPKPTTVGPNATVLKRSAVQSKGGLVLKAPEKPSLVSKPTAPPPAKSPWAVLPPVEKVPPVVPQAPPPQPQPQPPPAPASPAMEIAADSFTRSSNIGQLYNAQSGRYEPAITGRRGSVRKDQNFRPPSVLQRERGDHPRRDVSERRASDERRDSQHSHSPSTSSVTHSVPIVDGSPAQQVSQLVAQSPASQHAQLSERSATASPSQLRDEAAAQKQLMKEKREAAIKRKREEEARELAARKERIRLKMEAMGMDLTRDVQAQPEEAKEVKEEPKQQEAKQQQESKEVKQQQEAKEVKEQQEPKEPKQEPKQEPKDVKQEQKEVKEQHKQQEQKVQDVLASRTSKTPLPPPPDASGLPQQYGMITLHGTVPEKKHDKPPSPLVNGHDEATFRQPWHDIAKDKVTWQRDASHVWGTPGSRPIGNGAFQRQEFPSPNLAPIGPPKREQNDRLDLDRQFHTFPRSFDKPGLEQQKASLAAWGNFHATAAHEEAVKRQQYVAKLAEEARTGIRHEPQLPTMTETWRQVKVDDQSTTRSVISVTRGPAIEAFPAPGRASRFFPTGRTLHPYAPAPFHPGFRRGSSPPPPDSDLHPAFARDQPQPRVSLPLVGPRPKVRLPPASPLPKKVEPATKNPSWQDRINGLFGVKKPSPEKTFANPASAFSATKEPLASPVVRMTAAVSLPPPDHPVTLQVDSKDPTDEEVLFTPESGSLPVILLPITTPRLGPPRRAWGNGLSTIRLSKEVDAVTKDALMEVATMGNGGPMIFIRLVGMDIPKSKTITGIKRGSKSRPSSGNFSNTYRTHAWGGR